MAIYITGSCHYRLANHPRYLLLLLLAVTCSKLSPPTNGKLLGCNATQMIYSTVCTFSCKEGFEGKGSVVRSCTENGTWSGTDLVCTGNYYCLVITAYATFQLVFYNKLRLLNLLFADTKFWCYN